MLTKKIALEESTNTHELTHALTVEKNENFTVIEVDENQSAITHGEHRTMRIESRHTVVYRQNEFNPIRKAYQKVVD